MFSPFCSEQLIDTNRDIVSEPLYGFTILGTGVRRMIDKILYSDCVLYGSPIIFYCTNLDFTPYVSHSR